MEQGVNVKRQVMCPSTAEGTRTSRSTQKGGHDSHLRTGGFTTGISLTVQHIDAE